MSNNKKDKLQKKIWIIGMGRFGKLAFKRLSRKMDGCGFVLVDPDERNFAEFKNNDCVMDDGIKFIYENLSRENSPDWIIPALPIHLAAMWLMKKLGHGRVKKTELPKEFGDILPNPIYGENKDIYVSHATFLCPDNCPEPKDICTVTGEKRKENMFELLQNIRFPGFSSFVIRSFQLAPGVGGFRPGQLFELLKTSEKLQSGFIVATACRCHGVISGMEFK